MRSHPIDVAVVALAFTVLGLVALALVWSGDWAYRGLAEANGVNAAVFRTLGPCPPPSADCFVDAPISLDALLGWHREWVAYVTGRDATAPVSFGREIFTADEYAHMADVRAVFRGAEIAGLLAFVILALRLIRARSRGAAVLLLRSGVLVAIALVAVIGVVAAFAFDAVFLLFHEIFFPQGNFLFDPATSNLLRLYPDWYWQGITAGVAISFIAPALLVAVAAHLALRPLSNTYTRAP